MLGHLLDVAKVGGGLLEHDGQEHVDRPLHVDLLAGVKDLLHHAQQVLDYLCFSIGEQIHEGSAVAGHDVGDEVGIVLDDLAQHGYAVVALNPVVAFDVVVDGQQQLLVEGGRLLQLGEVDVGHFDGAGAGVHAGYSNSNYNDIIICEVPSRLSPLFKNYPQCTQNHPTGPISANAPKCMLKPA